MKRILLTITRPCAIIVSPNHPFFLYLWLHKHYRQGSKLQFAYQIQEYKKQTRPYWQLYVLLCDGMGSGEVARETSSFAAGFVERALSHGASKETVLKLLSEAIRRRGEECSASVDLFEFDLICGSATFLKSGAAPSFVKRGTSIFRLRSETAPIGLMRRIDTERIAVEVRGEDFVIMLSDGICGCAEDTPWLLELLAKPAPTEPRAYADLILKEAKAHTGCRDDMSVIVLKIEKI